MLKITVKIVNCVFVLTVRPTRRKPLPIYEFVCQACQNLVEILVKNPNQEIELKCAVCGSSELQRVVSRVNSIVTNGEGGKAGAGNNPCLENRSCPSGNCSSITLPGHSR